jgi:hypothetical protein
MLLSPTGAALSTKPLYQALRGRQENAHIEGGVIGPSSKVPDVGGSGSRSGMGADTSAIRHREHTQHSEKGLPTEHAWPIAVTPFRTSRQSASSGRGYSSNCFTVYCKQAHSSGTKGRNSIPMRPAPSPAPFLKHLWAKLLSGGRGFATRGC